MNDSDVELLRSVQSTVKRIGKRDPALRHLWLQKGVTCTRVEGRDLLAAIKRTTAEPAHSPASSTPPSSRRVSPPSQGASSGTCAIQSVRICAGLYSGLREVAKWHSIIRLFSQLQNLQDFIVEPNLRVRDPGSYLEVLRLLENRIPHRRRLELNTRQVVHPQDVAPILECLATAKNLRELVSRDIVMTGSTDLSSLLTGLVECLPQLAKIDLGLSTSTSVRPTTLTSDCIRVLCSASTSLTTVKLTGLRLPCDTAHIWAQALRSNGSMRHLHLGTSSTDDPTAAQTSSFLTPIVQCMMDHQWSLESFEVDGIDLNGDENRCYDVSSSLRYKQLQAMCSLNRARRHRVVHDSKSTRSDWISLMVGAQGDVNALYWLLLKNPCLCDVAAAPSRSMIGVRNRQRGIPKRLPAHMGAGDASSSPSIFEVYL
jgi:hypothetical protein